MCKKHHTAEQVRARAANEPPRPLPFSVGNHMGGVSDAPPCTTNLSFLGHRLIACYLGMFTLDSKKSNGMLYQPSGFSCAFENSWNEVHAFPRLADDVALVVLLPAVPSGARPCVGLSPKRHFLCRAEILEARIALKYGIPRGGAAVQDEANVRPWRVGGGSIRYFEYAPQRPWEELEINEAALDALPVEPGPPTGLRVYYLKPDGGCTEESDLGPGPKQLVVDDGGDYEEWTHSGVCHPKKPQCTRVEVEAHLRESRMTNARAGQGARERGVLLGSIPSAIL